MTRQTGMTERVRAILRAVGEPLSIPQIVEALGDGHVERNSIASLLNQRVHAGEVRVSLQDKRAHYALVADYVPTLPQRRTRAASTPDPVTPPAPQRAPHSGAPVAGAAPAVSVGGVFQTLPPSLKKRKAATHSPASPPPPEAAHPHAAPAAPGNPIDADAHAAADRLIAEMGQASAPTPAPAGLTLRIHLDFGDLPAQLRALAATLDGMRATP